MKTAFFSLNFLFEVLNKFYQLYLILLKKNKLHLYIKKNSATTQNYPEYMIIKKYDKLFIIYVSQI